MRLLVAEHRRAMWSWRLLVPAQVPDRRVWLRIVVASHHFSSESQVLINLLFTV